MSVTLPEDVAWVLNILGFMWPEADEDKLRACAQAWRDFGSELGRINQDAHQVAAQVTAENKGDSIDAFERYWQGIGGSGGDFSRAAEAADHMALALDGMAGLVEGVKLAIIVQLGILAAEIIADQIAAPETLGLSEGAAVGEIIVTRGIVRRIIQEGIRRIVSEIVQSLKGRVLEIFRKILATALRRAVTTAVITGGMDAAKQELDINVFHSRKGFDAGELAAATGTGAVLGAVIPGPRRTRIPEDPEAGLKAALRDEANTDRSPVGSNVHPNVPPYGGGKTSGVLRVKGQDIPLLSKEDGPGQWLDAHHPGGPGSGKNSLIVTHVEGHAAGIMQKHGLTDGDLYINQPPCDRGAMCRFNLHKILPPDSTLRVHILMKDDSVQVWKFTHGVPKWEVIS